MKLPVCVYKINKEFTWIAWMSFREICAHVKLRLDDGEIVATKRMKHKEIMTDIEVPENISGVYYAYRFVEINRNKWQEYLQKLFWEPRRFAGSICLDFVILVESIRGNIFAICWGNVSKSVAPYLDDYFWLDILSRIIKPEDGRIRALLEKKIAGQVFSQSKNFRSSTSIDEEMDFWSIFKQVDALISKEELAMHFWINNTWVLRKDIGFQGRSCFKLGSSVEAKDLIKYLSKLDDLLDDNLHPPHFYVNEMDLITSKDFKKRLNDKLYEVLWSSLPGLDVSKSFDLSNKDLESYLSADGFIFRYRWQEIRIEGSGLLDLGSLLEMIQQDSHMFSNSSLDIQEVCQKGELIAINAWGDVELTRGKLIDHISGEIILDERVYFIIEGEWFFVRDSFITKLSARFGAIAHENPYNWVALADSTWYSTEGQYNLRHVWMDGFLVFDTFAPQGIELMDFMRIEWDRLYIFHAKHWFGWVLRELGSQLEVSAKRLSVTLSSDQTYLRSLYDKAKRSSKPEIRAQFDNLTVDEFLTIFMERRNNIHYVMLILSDSDSIARYVNSNSNVWKLSVINAYQSVKLKWYWFCVKFMDVDSPNV